MVALQGEKLSVSKNHEEQLSVLLSVSDAELFSFNRERSIVRSAKHKEYTRAEIGELRFVVDDISEWRGTYPLAPLILSFNLPLHPHVLAFNAF